MNRYIALLMVVMLLFAFGSPASAAYSDSVSLLRNKTDPAFLLEVSSSPCLIPILVELKDEPVLDWDKKQTHFFHYFEKQITEIGSKESLVYRGRIESGQQIWLKAIQKQ